MSPARKNSLPYVAFLRGINVGGHAAIKMTDLKAAFEKMGFGGVKTVLASGNVIFATKAKAPALLAREVEASLRKSLAMEIGVVVRSLDDLRRLRSEQPFAGITVTPGIRFYVTFLSENAKTPTLAIPYAVPGKELRILKATASEVFSVLDRAKGKGTSEAMAIIEKEFGSGITTRNWNTVLKILA